ncbi:MAG: MBL fold metallo-hydrolase [Steroidobacteraceae bacterium]|nr:MBL fold metallo-hydrolase [Steroidobacteraceae bacterium]
MVSFNDPLALSDLVPGRLVRVAPGVQRLVAPNASLMTGPGTNSYVLGEPPVALLDPGPDDPAHLNLLLQAVPRPLFIFVTHTHSDHSRGARELAMRTGAPVVGLPPPQDGRQDEGCVPHIQPAHDALFQLERGSSDRDGERSSIAAANADRAKSATGAIQLRAIHTPGHASNHVCYLLEELGFLFSGDHVLDGVSPVILPPDGDMAAYLQSLHRLKSYPLRAIAPGHGRVLTEPLRVIDQLIAHRGEREAKVLARLKELRRATLDELLPRVYDDVRPELLPVARFSLEAHLIKLAREGRAGREGDTWLACAA